jgi:2'-5' RNA ligase
MRLFVAIRLDEDTVKHLKGLQAVIMKLTARVSYVKEFHLTLKFLGEVSDPDKVMQALDRVRFKPFEFSLSGIGFFPDKRMPRVIWVGIEPKRDVLLLQQQIDKHLAEAGFAKDHKFHPHITLGRVKHAEKDAFASIADTAVQSLQTKVASFSLIKSDLKPEGPAYTVLKRYNS